MRRLAALGNRWQEAAAGSCREEVEAAETMVAGSGRRPSGSRELGDGVHGEEVAVVGGNHGEEEVRDRKGDQRGVNGSR